MKRGLKIMPGPENTEEDPPDSTVRKAEGFSKVTKAAIGFATGAAAGYLLGTRAINPKHDLFVYTQVGTALFVGGINAARHIS